MSAVAGESASAPRPRPASRLWWLMPVVLLAVLMTMQIVMVSVAVNDSGFAVERDYYAKAVNWEQHQAQARLNAELGWQLDLATSGEGTSTQLEIRVQDGAQALSGASVKLEAFANAHAADRLELQLNETSPGTYRVQLPVTRPGLWELRFQIDHSSGRFTEVARRDLL